MTARLDDLVRDAARATPGKVAFLCGDRELTWAETDALVDSCAAALAGLGVAEGDRVGIRLGNTLDFPVVYFGVLRAGLVAVPLSTGYTEPELRHALTDSGARVLVTEDDLPDDLLYDATVGVEHVRTPEWLRDSARAVPVSLRAGEDVAAVLYTSGTSGTPRGAMLSHRALLANLDQCASIDPPLVVPDDRVLLVLPLFHVYGLNAALGMVARQGATGVLVERFDPVETLAEVERTHVTVLIGAPPVYVAWSMLPGVADALAGVRLALSGAAPLSTSVVDRVLDTTGHHVFEAYGLTETASVLTTTLMSEVPEPASVGRPLPGVELRLVDEEGRPVEDGDPGEVVVRSDSLFSGYWPDGADGPDEHGWFATGDIGLLDDDGDLRLVDRRREMVLVSGFNVYPREVEQVLLGHPEVAEAAVLGVPHPYTGESVKALVVLRGSTRLTPDEVIAHCARSLARFKCPTAVEFVGELPHSATGKVSKARLRAEGHA